MRENSQRFNPEVYALGNLLLTRTVLLKLLSSDSSQDKLNLLGNNLFCEKVFINHNVRISTTVRSWKSLPTEGSTFVVITFTNGNPEKMIIVPRRDQQPFEVQTKDLAQTTPNFDNTYIPTDPELIEQIIKEKEIKKQPLNGLDLRRTLEYYGIKYRI